jgi:hypothetical protein
MFPKWLQPIENVFRRAEKWMNTKRFLMVAGIFVALAVALGVYIMKTRKDTDWLKEPCGKIQWERSRLPAPVYADSTLPDDWIEPLKQGMALIDPSGKLLKYEGRAPLTTDDQTSYTILVEQWNDDQHGNTRHEVRKTDCKVYRMKVSVPVLLLPGKVRVRAAAHELGHSLGLGHSDWETHIMYPVASTLFPFSLSEHEKALLETYFKP